MAVQNLAANSRHSRPLARTGPSHTRAHVTGPIMRFAYSFVASCLVLTAAAQLSQHPIMPVVPPQHDAPGPDVSNGQVITDVLNRDRNINLFAGFIRSIESVGKRLDDGARNATVLALENSVVTGLPRKPWEDPEDYDKHGANAYDGGDGEERAHRNLRRFVEAHIVPESPWKANQKLETLAGNTVWYEHKDGKTLIQPGDIEVIGSIEKVDNGEVWVLNGVINYA